MKFSVLLSADQLDTASAARVAAACDGWARFERIAQIDDIERARAALEGVDVAVGWVPAATLRDSGVSVYLCGSAGYDAYVGRGLGQKPNFRLTNAAGLMTVSIAEHCMAMLLALTRKMPMILLQQRERRYERRYDLDEIAGTTACVVGLGGVGTELCRRLRAFGVRTLGVCRNPQSHAGIADETHPLEALSGVLARADYVFAVIAGVPATRGLFCRDTFAAMKSGALFFTAARGSVTRQDDLCEALVSGRLAGAGVDVYAREPLEADSPLWTLPNVIVSPHSAGLSKRLNGRLADLFAENLHRLRDGKPLKNLVPPERLD